jgi:hypothetical protein
MKQPNRRYGNPTEMAYYAFRYPSTKELARSLRRSERSVKDWLSGRAKVPWWVPEIMRLKEMEHHDIVRQITGRTISARLGQVSPAGKLIDMGLRLQPVEDVPQTAPTERQALAAALAQCK